MKTDSFSLSKTPSNSPCELWMKKVSTKFHSHRVTEKKRETERENGCAEIPGPPQRRWLRRWLRHRRRLRGSPFLTLSLSLKTLLVSLSKIVNCCCFLQTLKSQLFSLTSVAPDDQKVLSLSLSLYVFVCVCVYIYIYIFKNLWEIVFLQIIALDENRVLSDDSDLISVSERLRLVSVNDEVNEQPQPQLSSHIAGNDAASVIQKSWSKFHSFFGFGSGFSWKWFWFWWFIGGGGQQ